MFFSKLILKWPYCRNPYDWHNLIWELFPGRSESCRDFLFAIVSRKSAGDINALLLSKERPYTRDVKGIELLDVSDSFGRLSFFPGQMLQFRLTANPAKKILAIGDAKRKIRVPLINTEHQIDWIKKKLDGMAEVLHISVQPDPPIYFKKEGKGGKINPVTFEGILKVIDPNRLKEQLYQRHEDSKYIAGIGPGKSFGCGLMLVRRV